MDTHLNLLPKPPVVYTNVLKPDPIPEKFKDLVDLFKKGPFPGRGRMGPKAHNGEPTGLFLDKEKELVVHAWGPDTLKKTQAVAQVIFVGTFEDPANKQQLVLYLLADETTGQRNVVDDGEPGNKSFSPSTTDSRLFIMSFNNFKERVTHVYPAFSVMTIAPASSKKEASSS